MIKLEADKMSKAIAKAKTVHPKVRVINADQRAYAVYGSRGDAYTVKFAVANGHKLGECSCPARGLCYHIVAAAAVNIAVQSMRRHALRDATQAASVPAVSIAVDIAASPRKHLIIEIKNVWPKSWPPLYTELLARFGKSDLNGLDDDQLRRVRLALAA